MTAPRRILVIRHGALGDFVLSTGPFRAIRAHHLADQVTLLTSAPFENLAVTSGLFNHVWIDTRPSLFAPRKWLGLRRSLRKGGFSQVYDLQTSQRSSFYFRLFGSPKPEWSGIAPGASHQHTNPRRTGMHTLERQREQLAVAGISHVPPPDLDWVTADLAKFALRQPYALLVPGGSAHRPQKRWPVAHYADLAGRLSAAGLRPVVLGTTPEQALGQEIAGSGGLDLTGQTDLADIAELARGATVAVGNDTGAMHMAAAVGCRSVVLFSSASDPALCAPRGDHVLAIQMATLAKLSVDEVARTALGGDDR